MSDARLTDVKSGDLANELGLDMAQLFQAANELAAEYSEADASGMAFYITSHGKVLMVTEKLAVALRKYCRERQSPTL